MERRRLGRLEHRSSVLIFGGAALGEVTQDVADRAIELALEAGINHLDTAAGYGDSELRIGAWMPRIRDRVFLATKTGERTASAAYDGIRRSIERLRVDHVDLLQLHSIGDLEDLDRATGSDGALEGAIRAREEGLIGGIGITGHGMAAPAVHLEALRRFPFDTVLTPYSYRLTRYADYLRDFDALAEEVRERDIGLMLIKAFARNLWRDGEQERGTTWYEPLEEQGAIDAAVAFARARPEATGLCTPGDVRLLPAVLEAERRSRSISPNDAAVELDRVPDLEPPFLRQPGRVVPDWLEPLMPDR
jgi:aryl-alcohol dehydrogenase-like predicted oxidoreductase